MAEDANANIRIDIDTTAATAALKALQSQIARFHTEMARGGAVAGQNASKLQQDLINSINAGGQFQAGMTKVQSTTEAFTTALEKNKLSMGQYFRYAGASTKTFGRFFRGEFETITKVATERVKDLQTQYVSMGRDANGALKAIKVRPLTLDMNDLATKTMIAAQKQQLYNQLLKQGSTNLLNFGKNTQWAGRQLMVGFTLPLSLFASTAAKSFMEIEKQIIKIRRVYGDFSTTVAETDQMIDSIKSLAGEYTKYGVAVSDTLGLAAEAAAAGKSGQELLAQISQATRLAVLGNVEQTQALETTMSVTNAFGVATEDLASKIDFLNAVENQSVTSIEDLTIAIPKAGPVVQQLGGDVEDLAFFLTAMKEGGINASEGANALKSGLAALINPTGKAKDMLNDFGINIDKIVNSNKGDIKGLVLDFASALDTLNPLDRARAIEQLFGKFQFSRLSTLFQNVIGEGTQASRVLELTKATTQELAILSQRELKKVEETTTYKFEKAFADFQAALAPVGEEFLKAITPVIEFGTKLLNQFNNMGDGAKSFAVILTTVVAGIGPVLLMTVGLVANGVANLIKMFQALGNIFKRSGADTTTLGLQTEYMTQQQLEAAAVAASLNQSHSRLAQTFSVEAASLNALTAAYQKAVTAQRGFAMPGGRVAGSATKPKKYADGVVSVPGPKGKGDVVPAMLSPGEAVIPAKMAKKYGGLIEGMVADNIPGYSKSNIKRDSVPTSVSVSGGDFETTGYSRNAMYLPKNTASGFGGDLFGDPERVRLSFLASMKTAIADARKLSQTDRTRLVLSEELNPQIDKLKNTYINLASDSKNMTDLATRAYPAIRSQIKEMLDAGEITLRQAAELNIASRGMFNPTERQLTDRTGTKRHEIGRDDSGNYFVKRAVTERTRAGARDRTKGAYMALLQQQGLGQSLKGETWAHTAPSTSLGTTTVPARTRTASTPEDVAIANAVEKHLNSGGILKENQKLSLNKSGELLIDGVAAEVVKGVKTSTKQASPSKEAYNSGANIGQGSIDGINSKIDDAKVAGEKVGQATVNGTQAGAKPGGQRGSRRAQTGAGAPGSNFITTTGRTGSRQIVVPVDQYIVPGAPERPIPESQSERDAAEKAKIDRKEMIRQRAKNAFGVGGKIKKVAGSVAAGVKGMGGMGAGMGLAAAGGTVASMVPGLEGVGMAASMAGSALMMFPGPVGIVIASLVGLVGILMSVHAAMEQQKQAAIDLAEAQVMSMDKLNTMAEDFGTVSATEARISAEDAAAAGVTEKQLSAGQQYLTEMASGQQFVADVKTQQAAGMTSSEIGKNVAADMATAVAQGVVTQQQATEIIAALGSMVGDRAITAGASQQFGTYMEDPTKASGLVGQDRLTQLQGQFGAASETTTIATGRGAVTSMADPNAALGAVAGTMSAYGQTVGGVDAINAQYDALVKEATTRKEINALEKQRTIDVTAQKNLAAATYAELEKQKTTIGAVKFNEAFLKSFDKDSEAYKTAEKINGLKDSKLKTQFQADFAGGNMSAATAEALVNAADADAALVGYYTLKANVSISSQDKALLNRLEQQYGLTSGTGDTGNDKPKKCATCGSKAHTTANHPDDGGDSGSGSGSSTPPEDKVLTKLQAKLDKRSKALNIISLEEKKVNKIYDERKKALEEIARINSQISEQQKGQLDVANALASGDIAAAARAVQAERARSAAFAQEQQMKALEEDRKNSLDSITFKGMTRESLEAQIDKLNMQIAKREYKNASGGGMMKGYSAGGRVMSYFANGGSPLGSDTIPAMLTPGEFVIKRPAVQNFGVKKLEAINSGKSSDSSVYTYNVSVNVATNSDPDAIARTVVTKIRNVDKQRLGGNSY